MSVFLENEAVLRLSLSLPMNGPWSAELQVASDVERTTGETVTLQLPGDVSFLGRVVLAGRFAERMHLTLTGGTSDWSQLVDTRHYRNSDGDQAMRDLGVQTEAPLELDLPYWTRPIGTIGAAVQALAGLAQVNWRVLSNGTVRMRAEAPFAVEPNATLISRDDARGLVTVAPDFAFVQPGTIHEGDAVEAVEYTLDEDSFRCRYWTQPRSSAFVSALGRLVRWAARDALYLGQYTAQVISQSATGDLDLMPEDSRLRADGLQAVPIRHGLPGVKVQVAPGERVLLAFDGGDPRKPYAALWHAGQVLSVEIGGQLPVAIAQLIEARLSAMQLVIDTHVHTSAAPASPTTPPVPPIVWPVLPMASLILKSS